ncbi:MAG: Zn-binding domain-containing protein [Pseudomonadota bacterium]
MSFKRLLQRIRVHPLYKGQLSHVSERKARGARLADFDSIDLPFAEKDELQASFRRLVHGDPYAYQVTCAEALFNEQPVVISLPPGTGRTTTCDFLTSAWISSGRGSVIRLINSGPLDMVVPFDGQATAWADAATQAFQESLGRTGAESIIDVSVRLADLRPPDKISDVLLTTPENLSRYLDEPENSGFARFLSRTTLLVWEDVHLYAGARSGDASLAFRRLWQFAEAVGTRIQVCLTMDQFRNPQGFAENLTGLDGFQLLGDDDAPRAEVTQAFWHPPLVSSTGQVGQYRRQGIDECVRELVTILLEKPREGAFPCRYEYLLDCSSSTAGPKDAVGSWLDAEKRAIATDFVSRFTQQMNSASSSNSNAFEVLVRPFNDAPIEPILLMSNSSIESEGEAKLSAIAPTGGTDFFRTLKHVFGKLENDTTNIIVMLSDGGDDLEAEEFEELASIWNWADSDANVFCYVSLGETPPPGILRLVQEVNGSIVHSLANEPLVIPGAVDEVGEDNVLGEGQIPIFFTGSVGSIDDVAGDVGLPRVGQLYVDGYSAFEQISPKKGVMSNVAIVVGDRSPQRWLVDKFVHAASPEKPFLLFSVITAEPGAMQAFHRRYHNLEQLKHLRLPIETHNTITIEEAIRAQSTGGHISGAALARLLGEPLSTAAGRSVVLRISRLEGRLINAVTLASDILQVLERGLDWRLFDYRLELQAHDKSRSEVRVEIPSRGVDFKFPRAKALVAVAPGHLTDSSWGRHWIANVSSSSGYTLSIPSHLESNPATPVIRIEDISHVSSDASRTVTSLGLKLELSRCRVHFRVVGYRDGHYSGEPWNFDRDQGQESGMHKTDHPTDVVESLKALRIATLDGEAMPSGLSAALNTAAMSQVAGLKPADILTVEAGGEICVIDLFPGGSGLCEALLEDIDELIEVATENLLLCACTRGDTEIRVNQLPANLDGCSGCLIDPQSRFDLSGEIRASKRRILEFLCARVASDRHMVERFARKYHPNDSELEIFDPPGAVGYARVVRDLFRFKFASDFRLLGDCTVAWDRSGELPQNVLGQYSYGSRKIMLRSGLIEDQAIYVLAHEMVHHWQNVSGQYARERLEGGEIPHNGLLFTEGSAQWMARHVVDALNLHDEIASADQRRGDEYGEGFKCLKYIECQFGMRAVFVFLRSGDISKATAGKLNDLDELYISSGITLS